jgi:hypothetical protein
MQVTLYSELSPLSPCSIRECGTTQLTDWLPANLSRGRTTNWPHYSVSSTDPSCEVHESSPDFTSPIRYKDPVRFFQFIKSSSHLNISLKSISILSYHLRQLLQREFSLPGILLNFISISPSSNACYMIAHLTLLDLITLTIFRAEHKLRDCWCNLLCLPDTSSQLTPSKLHMLIVKD